MIKKTMNSVCVVLVVTWAFCALVEPDFAKQSMPVFTTK